MKNLDLNEILTASMKNLSSNYKSEAPPWFMPGQSSFNLSNMESFFHSLLNQLLQFSVFQGRTVHRFSLYIPDMLKHQSLNIDKLISIIQEEQKNLKLIYRSDQGIMLISADEILSVDVSSDTIHVASLNGTKLKSLNEKIVKNSHKK